MKSLCRCVLLCLLLTQAAVVAAPPPIVINEWMVSNQTTLADPADGEFEDWIELFNPNPFPVDLSGWHLTDNLSNPTQWSLPPGTAISAGAYLVIWADLETAQLGFHANFQLEPNEAIVLFGADPTQQVDAVAFGEQANDVSQGRVPNGSGVIRYMTSPSPGAANTATSLIVTNVNNNGPGSLRQAIRDANIMPGPDTISFNIPEAGPHTITPTNALPSIDAPLTIDGYTQPGSSPNTLSNGNNAVLRIELNGENAGGANGLFINTSNCLVRGLVINRWIGSGIQIYISNRNNVIQGNFIGTDPTGSLARSNGLHGVYLLRASENLIGGPSPSHRNVISANAQSGVAIWDLPGGSNRVEGNYIGVNAAGTAALGNVFFGVIVQFSAGNSIGGTTPGAGNLISGNLYGAMSINGVENTIEGNLVGTDLHGSVAIPNRSGIGLGSGNRVGGTNAASRNVISGNFGSGVQLGAGSVSNIIQGNFIGINAAGSAALSNENHGIEIQNASYNLIGGAAGAGNVISGNGLTAITLNIGFGGSCHSNQVQGNLIGTDPSGTVAIPNGTRSNHPAIQIAGASHNVIGGSSSLERNIISGNFEYGIMIQTPAATNNRIMGNFIGTDISGVLPLGNLVGLWFDDAPNNTVGNNVISGNGTGIRMMGTNSRGNVIQGNLIGTDVTGLSALGNTEEGIGLYDAPDNTIGSNVLSGNRVGVIIAGINGSGNVIYGNIIGLDASGLLALPNEEGINIVGSSGNLIGGVTGGTRNLISGNAGYGVLLNAGANANQIFGNYIGTRADGSTPVGNGFAGVTADAAPGNFIGGSGVGQGNVISGNGIGSIPIGGVYLFQPGSQNNIVAGNRIGTDPTGLIPVPNAGGVLINGAANNMIGGSTATAANIIAFNTHIGVSIYGDTATGNAILRNSIFANESLGIDLGPDGVTPNDLGDTDGSPNHLQNFPELTNAASSSGFVTISGALNSTPGSDFTLEFFSSPAGDASGYGEGQIFVGSASVHTTGSGSAPFSLTFAATVAPGNVVTATATDPDGNTSEFSQAQTVTAAAPGQTFTVGNTNDSGPGSLRQAILAANATPGADVIGFNIPGAGVRTIAPLSELPTIRDPVTIDGYTQPGASANTLANGNNAILLIELSGQNASEAGAGLAVITSNCVVRGLVINRFDPVGQPVGMGIQIGGTGNIIQGNFIGVDATGLNALPNTVGINVRNSSANLIGGVSPAACNLISGNLDYGVLLDRGASANQVFGNYIGTRADGRAPLGNGRAGVVMDAAPGNFIGGAGAGEGNLISGNGIGAGVNAIGGVYLFQPASQNNVIAGNRIGTDSTGTIAVPNDNMGVMIYLAANNLIGGSTIGAGNVIAFNAWMGVRIFDATSVGNAILQNSIYANEILGINLGPDVVTPNDMGDADAGPNRLQNFPVLSDAWRDGNTFVQGELNSAAGSTYRLEFFANAVADLSGHGEGQTFLGATNISTDGTGNAQFLASFATVVPAGHFVTTTATDGDNNTSEFSAALAVASSPPIRALILVNGQVPLTAAISVTNFAVVDLWSSLPNAVIYYTRDGSDPSTTPLSYTTPFVVIASEIVRAVAYTADFSHNIAVGPLAITIQAPPTITLQPQSQSVPQYSTVLLSVQAQGTAPLSFQWLTNGIPLTGATAATLNLTSVVPEQSGTYQIAITNAFGAVTSAVAMLTVLSPAGITTGPITTNVPLGSNATFCVTASGSPPLIYQWRKNGVNIPGATNDCLTITNVQLSDGGSYNVVVANELGSVSSPPAQLIVEVPSPPAQDHFTNRVSLLTRNGTNTGSNAFATEEAGEPDHAGKPCSNSVWYTWTAAANGIARFRTTGSTFDTLIGVYTGATVSTLTEIARDDDAGGFLASEIVFNATNGMAYQIAVDGLGGASGSFVLRWELEETTNRLPAITMQPCDAVVLGGGSTTFTVGATPQPLTYQWYFNGQAIQDATNSSYTLGSVVAANVGFYSVHVSNGATQIMSRAALLEINSLLTDTSKEKIQDLLAPLPCGPGRLRLIPLNTAPSVAMGSIGSATVDATTLNNLSECVPSGKCGGIAEGARYIRLRMESAGTCVLEAIGSNSRIKIWVCRGGFTDVETANNHDYLDCEETLTPDGRATLSFQAQAGRQYLVWYARLDRVAGPIELRWRLGAPPVVAQPPVSRFARAGDAVTFSIVATNTYGQNVDSTKSLPHPSVLWLSGDLPAGPPNAVVASTLSGLSTVNSSLTLPSAALGDAGTYTAIVSNAIGSTSVVARLSLIDATTALRTFETGEPVYLGEVVSSDPSCATGYQWRFAGTNLPLQTNLTLQLSQASLSYAGAYSLIVTNCIGAQTSTVARVTVKADLRIEPWLEGRDMAFRFVTDKPANAAVVEWLPEPSHTNWLHLLSTGSFQEPISLPRTNHPSAVYRARLLP